MDVPASVKESDLPDGDSTPHANSKGPASSVLVAILSWETIVPVLVAVVAVLVVTCYYGYHHWWKQQKQEPKIVKQQKQEPEPVQPAAVRLIVKSPKMKQVKESTDSPASQPSQDTQDSQPSQKSGRRSPSPHRPSPQAESKQQSSRLKLLESSKMKVEKKSIRESRLKSAAARTVSKTAKQRHQLFKRSPRQQDKTEVALRGEIKDRKKEEKAERQSAEMAVDYVLKLTGLYTVTEFLPDMGGHVQKYWFKVTPTGSEGNRETKILTICPVSRHCHLLLMEKETMKTLTELIVMLQVHPFLQPVEYVHYLSDRKQVIIVQPFREQGSLKDIIYNNKPTLEWSDKYQVKEQTISSNQIALFGRQILEAMVFLKEKFQCRPNAKFILGHVQSGNIFVQDGVCRLGGYENTLLGYRSRFYRMCEELLEHMDVIMFGHLVFEMSCAYELTTLAPTEQDYQAVKDEEIKNLLLFTFGREKSEENESKKTTATVPLIILFLLNLPVIGLGYFIMATVVMVIGTILLLSFYGFNWWRSFQLPVQEVKVQFPTVHEIKKHPFFKSVPVPQLDKFDGGKVMLTADMKKLISVLK